MSGTDNTHGYESTKTSTDNLEHHAPDTADVRTEPSSTTSLVETSIALFSDAEAEPGARTTSGLSAESNFTLKVESAGATEIEPSAGHTYDSGDSEETTNYSRPGVQVGSISASTSGDQPAASIVAYVVSKSSGDATMSLDEDSSNKQTFASSSLSPQSTIIGGANLPGTDRTRQHGKEEVMKRIHRRDIFPTQSNLGGFVSSLYPSIATRPKKSSETRTTQRWKMAFAYIKKINAMKRRALSSPIGTGATLHGHALGILSIETQRSFVIQYHPSNHLLRDADIIITTFYTVECAARIVTLGLFWGPHAYLRNNFNKLDLVIIVDSWIHIIKTYIMGGDSWIRLATLRIFRALIVLRHFSIVGDIFAILVAMRECFGALQTFMILTLMFGCFFAMLGVQFFAGAFHSRMSWMISLGCVVFSASYNIICNLDHCRCRRFYDLSPNVPDRPCFKGLYQSRETPSFTNNCNTPKTLGYDVCLYAPNPNYGATNFDNFASSLLIVFQVITFEGWSLISKWARNTTGLGADAYFFVLLICGSYFLVNIYIAVISGVFLKVRQEHKVLMRRYHRGKSFSFTNALQMARLLKEVILSNDAKLILSQRLRRKTKRLSKEFCQTLSRQSVTFKRTMSRAIYWNDPISHMNSDFELRRIDSKDLYSDDKENLLSLSQHYMEIVLLVLFGVELLVRFLADGLFEFVDERMNVIDLVVVMISYWNIGPNRKFLNLTPVRMLRWFYIKRTERTHRDGEGAPILTAILRSVGQLHAVYFFLFLVIVIFSIFSMELWGGQIKFADGFSRANHDNFGQAIILWFTVTTGESWVNYMWDVMRPEAKNRWVAPFMFVFYFIVTSYIILNLIIATVLEEMELTDNQKNYIQKKEHLKWLQKKHYHHLSSTRRSDWIIDAVEGAQKNFVNVKRLIMSMRVSHMFTIHTSRSEALAAQEQDDVLPTKTTENDHNSIYGPITTTTSGFSPIPTKQTSSSTVVLPSLIEPDVTLKAKVVRRRSTSVLSTTHQAPIRRRHSQEVDPLLLRSGFNNTNLAAGESKTALQSALMAVVDDKAKGVAINQNETRDNLSTTATRRAPPYGRTKNGRGISFNLSDFQASPTFEVRRVPWWMNNRSVFLFTPDSSIRRLIIRIIEHKVYMIYEYGYVTLGMWCFLRHLPNGWFTSNLVDQKVNKVYTSFLGVDILLKVVAYGFLFTPEAFLSDPYNWIEIPLLFFAVMKSKYFYAENEWRKQWDDIASLFINFRPLTLIGRFHGMRIMVNNIVRTMPVILQIFVFVLVVYAIFGVIGIQLFANRFRYCTDSSVVGHNDCVGFFRNEVGVLAIRTWVNRSFHFDNFGNAMLSLFVGSTFDNWPDYFLYPATDLAHKHELQPQRNISPSKALYFITFMCIGGFFIIRMFVSVFIDQFRIISGSKLLTERQKLWRDTNRLIQGLGPKIKPTEPADSPLRQFCFCLVYSKQFELAVIFTILANYVYVTTRHEDSSNNIPIDMYDDGGQNSSIETMFVSLYAIEMTLKLLGTQLLDWWDDKWNIVELCMLIISASCLYPGLIIYVHAPLSIISGYPGIPSLAISKYPPRQFLGAFFIFLRIFRIIRYFSGLKIMMTAAIIALPAMIDTMALMFIVILIFMGIGGRIFGSISTGYCITRKLGPNFESIGQSFSAMMQIMTLDNWSCMLLDITIKQPFCIKGLDQSDSNCGAPVVGIIFMMFAISLTTYILANIFVAQILDTITFGLIKESILLAPTDLIGFQALWSQKKYDSKCTGYIGQHKLKDFLIELGPPLGGRRRNFSKWYTRIDYEVSYFRNPKGVAFRPLLETVCLYKVGPRGLELPVRIERERLILTIYQNGAAVKMQALVRGFLHRSKKKQTDDKPQRSTTDIVKPENQLDVSRQPLTDWSHLDSTTTSSVLGSDMQDEKSVLSESSSHLYDGLSQECHMSVAASSAYDTPMSTTPVNETTGVTSSSEIELVEP